MDESLLDSLKEFKFEQSSSVKTEKKYRLNKSALAESLLIEMSPSRSGGNDTRKRFTEFTHCQNFFTVVRKQLERVIARFLASALVFDHTKLLI